MSVNFERLKKTSSVHVKKTFFFLTDKRQFKTSILFFLAKSLPERVMPKQQSTWTLANIKLRWKVF
jgi:hypothetical protein